MGQLPTVIDVAYLAAADTYYAAWNEQDASEAGSTIHGRPLASNGAPVASIRSFINLTSGPFFAFKAHVASIEAARSFAVVMIGGLFYNADGWMTVVDEFGSFPRAVRFASPVNGVISVDVGGEATTTADDFLIAYSTLAIHLAQVDAGTVAVVRRLDLSAPPPGSLDGSVAITPSGASTGRYLVTWRRSTAQIGDIWGAVIDRNLNTLVAPFPITDDAMDDDDPDVDGDGTNWVVVFERRGVRGDTDIVYRGVSYVPGTGGVRLSAEQVVEGDAEQIEQDPTVAWMGESFLVGYTEIDGGNADVFVESIDPFERSRPQERYSVLEDASPDTNATQEQGVKIASQSSAGFSGSQALVTWISIGGHGPTGSSFLNAAAGTRVFQADAGVVRQIGARSR